MEGNVVRSQSKPSTECMLGRHVPRSRHRDILGQPVQRSACRRCGTAIVKSAVSRRWIVSGLLG
jgi:hypothetical protein